MKFIFQWLRQEWFKSITIVILACIAINFFLLRAELNVLHDEIIEISDGIKVEIVNDVDGRVVRRNW